MASKLCVQQRRELPPGPTWWEMGKLKVKRALLSLRHYIILHLADVYVFYCRVFVFSPIFDCF